MGNILPTLCEFGIIINLGYRPWYNLIYIFGFIQLSTYSSFTTMICTYTYVASAINYTYRMECKI